MKNTNFFKWVDLMLLMTPYLVTIATDFLQNVSKINVSQ